MIKKLIRVYQKLDFSDIREHTMVYGDLAAACSKCNALNVRITESICPECRTEFKYIAFRNVRNHLPKMNKIHEENPKIRMIDFDDYKRILAEIKAQEFWE